MTYTLKQSHDYFSLKLGVIDVEKHPLAERLEYIQQAADDLLAESLERLAEWEASQAVLLKGTN